MISKKDYIIDELAYQFYLTYLANSLEHIIYNKSYFIENKNIFKDFYNQANNFLRKEKIEKINKNV